MTTRKRVANSTSQEIMDKADKVIQSYDKSFQEISATIYKLEVEYKTARRKLMLSRLAVERQRTKAWFDAIEANGGMVEYVQY